MLGCDPTGPRVLRSWEIAFPSYHGTPLGFLRVFPPIKYFWEDDWLWETPSPGIPPPVPTRVVLLLKTSDAVDPAKRGLERTKIEPTMLDFRPGAKRALPAHRAESDRRSAFLFWNVRRAASPYPQVIRRKSDHPHLPGGGGVKIPLLHVPQTKQIKPTRARSAQPLTFQAWGVKIAKIAIVPDHTDRALRNVTSIVGHVPVNASLCGGQIHFRATPVVPPSCKWVWGL
ncbi:hypothetical protein BDM02DRAFT_3127881 [Thelephora ganbajun]|uniref:Uncharacterized protein n=1 Tax=Thelephora ganbajun TaxID=370292 RepID=A0ACB6ZKH3_THEGA|nr:hypothetical protein BDM02DRAFT_3127881 [Thelephora ganbajun]